MSDMSKGTPFRGSREGKVRKSERGSYEGPVCIFQKNSRKSVLEYRIETRKNLITFNRT